MPHVFIVWGYCWEIKWKGQWNTRISGPMYIISSVAKTWKCFAESMNARVKGYFYILWKSWKQLAWENILIRSSDSERALKLCRNIGKKNQCDSNYTEKNFCGESLSVWWRRRNANKLGPEVTFGVKIAEERNDTIGVRQSRWTRLVTGLLKAWPPNPVCQFRAERINYHTNALPFNQIVIKLNLGRHSAARFGQGFEFWVA